MAAYIETETAIFLATIQREKQIYRGEVIFPRHRVGKMLHDPCWVQYMPCDTAVAIGVGDKYAMHQMPGYVHTRHLLVLRAISAYVRIDMIP